MKPETKNAKIEKTFLGIEDHGILTCWLYMTYGGSNQGFGGYFLEHYGLDMIKEILKVAGVESWEQLPGKHIRVYTDESGLVRRIGHFLNDVWYSPEGK